MNRFERADQLLIVVFLTVLAFPVLYAGRSLDDNTLTNWQWVFRQGGAVQVFLLTTAAAFLSLLLSKIEPDPGRYPLILFFAAAAAVVPLWDEPEVILDAGRYFSQAKHLALNGPASFLRGWGGEISAWTDLPAIPFAYGVVFRIFGETRFAVQCFTSLLFCLAVVSTYRIGRALWNEETGFLAGLLLLAFPYLLTQVPLMLVDVPVMALVTFSLDAFLEAINNGGPRRSAVAVAFIVLAVSAKFSAWMMLFVLPLAAAVAVLNGDRIAARRAVLVLGAASVLCAMLAAAKYEVIAGQLRLLREYQLPGLGRWSESTLATFLFQAHPFVALLSAWGAVTALRNRDIRFAVPFWAVLFASVLQVERIRYLLPLFPLFALMAAYGLHELTGDNRIRRTVAFSAAGASLVLAFFAYLPFLSSTTMANLRDAGRYLDELPGEAVEVYVVPQQRSIGNTEASIPLLDLYTHKRIVRRQERLPRPDEGKLLTLPLRFTWEAGQPAWYASGSNERGSVRVIISSEEDDVPFGSAGKRFAKDTGTFRYRTVVTVLERSQLAQKAH